MQLPPFDQAKPFFPLVMNFAAQMIGFKETMEMANLLALRKMLKQIFDASHFQGEPFRLFVSANSPLDGYDLAHPLQDVLRQRLKRSDNMPLERLLNHTAPFEIVGPRPLKCLTQEEGIIFSAEEVAGVYLTGGEKHVKASSVSAGSLIVSAFEAVRKPQTDVRPLWQFFRHCRNAAAHGGRFNLLPGEPSRPATWKSLTIHPGLHGTPLFDIWGEKGLLGLGDSILLLWDIERLCL